jgi:hypothetical protein
VYTKLWIKGELGRKGPTKAALLCAAPQQLDQVEEGVTLSSVQYGLEEQYPTDTGNLRDFSFVS